MQEAVQFWNSGFCSIFVVLYSEIDKAKMK